MTTETSGGTALRICKISVLLALLAPPLWLATLYSFVLRARLKLGAWPRPNAPDPKVFGFELHRGVALFGWLAIPVTLLLATVCVTYCTQRRLDFKWTPYAVAYAVVILAWWLIVLLDPGDYLAWFAG